MGGGKDKHDGSDTSDGGIFLHLGHRHFGYPMGYGHSGSPSPPGYPPLPGAYPPNGYPPLNPPPLGTYPPPGYPHHSYGYPPSGYPPVGYPHHSHGYPPSGYPPVGYPPVGYPGTSAHYGHGPSMGPMLAGGTAAAAMAYGAHKLSHGHPVKAKLFIASIFFFTQLAYTYVAD